MGSRGYQSWSSPVHRTLILNGEVFRVGSSFPHRWQRESAANVLPTHGRTQIIQSRIRGGSEPLSMSTVQDRIDFQVDTREELERLQYAASLTEGGAPSLLYVDSPITDVWALANRASGQTNFQASRRTPFGLPGITRVTRPPTAQTVDSAGALTELTVVAASPPSAGEIYIPDATGTNFATFEAPSAMTGEYLRVQYNPELMVIVDEISYTLSQANDWAIELRFEEVLLEARTGL